MIKHISWTKVRAVFEITLIFALAIVLYVYFHHPEVVVEEKIVTVQEPPMIRILETVKTVNVEVPVIVEKEVVKYIEPESFVARVTFYTDDDVYGDKVADPKTRRAKEGVTVAAAKDLDFGTKLRIPDLEGVVGTGNFIVQDRGAHVQKRVASRGKTPIVDVYVSSRAKLKSCKTKLPEYMVVHVLDSIDDAKQLANNP